MPSTKTKEKPEVTEARADLLKLVKPGDTVYTVLRQVSSSGMSRVIDLVIPYQKEIRWADEVTPRALKLGAPGYGQTGEMRYSSGKVSAFDDETVTFTYEHSPEKGTATFPRAEVRLYRVKHVPAVRSIGWVAAKAMERNFDRDRQGIKIGGCGMDMGFALVYDLGATLWPKGTKKPHGTRNGSPDRDGGYALNHVWL